MPSDESVETAGRATKGAPLVVVLHGCTIGDNSLVGMGAIMLNGSKIGANCLVGAGALITEGKTFPDNSLIVGSPARAPRVPRVRSLPPPPAPTPSEIQRRPSTWPAQPPKTASVWTQRVRVASVGSSSPTLVQGVAMPD